MNKIVIVEDEYRTRIGLKNLIVKLNSNFEIIGDAEDGKEGINIVKNLNPDIVFTDIKMPKIDGLKMIEDIQQMGLSPKFVLLTGFADFEYARKALRLGVTDYILKPVSIKKMKILLEKLSKNNKIEEFEGELEYSKIVTNMIQTIHSCYGQNLSLTKFSDKYNLCTEYISSIFSRETGENFTIYLKNYRIEKAKELLANGEDKIYEVASKVGYNDSKYFSRVFKDYTGISASSFIEQRKINSKE
ncbi:MAG: response regulator [Spirochaetaceae bacterium]|nr:response regulator [Spirochaetaceae bacterium]